MTVAESLTGWADGYLPDSCDLALARRSLTDTVAVTLAARGHPLREMTAGLPDAVRWATLGHVLDFDDLHIESTSHISVVVVPAVLAVGGDAWAYLAGAGVMARLGMMLGWPHYAAGWHATCTAGALAAAVAADVTLGLSPGQLTAAMALAVPAAGGMQAAFGTYGKSLQAGFAAGAGVRAAKLARAGATADPRALDAWLALVGGTAEPVPAGGPAVPGGLAVKLFPCCYAMQRPIAALRAIWEQIGGEEVVRVWVATPESATRPLIHDRPRTGLEGKFSMPYAVAAAVLDVPSLVGCPVAPVTRSWSGAGRVTWRCTRSPAAGAWCPGRRLPGRPVIPARCIAIPAAPWPTVMPRPQVSPAWARRDPQVPPEARRAAWPCPVSQACRTARAKGAQPRHPQLTRP